MTIMNSNNDSSSFSFCQDNSDPKEINLREDNLNTNRITQLRNMDGFSIIQIGSNNNVNIKVSKTLNQTQQNQFNQNNFSSHLSSNQSKQLIVPRGEVSDEVIKNIGPEIGVKWKELGRKLQITESQLEIIHADNYVNGTREMSYKMLVHWKEKFAKEATYRSLANALLAVNLKPLAKNLAVKDVE